MSGLSEGFYDDPNKLGEDQCFNQDAIDAVYNMIEGYHHGESTWDTFFKVSTAAYVFLIALQTNCKSYIFFYDAVTYCFRSSQCDSFDVYIYNLGVNLFPIMLYFMQIVETLIAYRKPANLHEVSYKYQLIGTELSNIFTALVDLHVQQTIMPIPV